MITDLVKMIAKAIAAQTDEQQIEYLNDAYDIAYCLYYALCLEIIGYCIDRVEEYLAAAQKRREELDRVEKYLTEIKSSLLCKKTKPFLETKRSNLFEDGNS